MKRIGIHKIADLAKVSIGTVDRALHGRAGVSEATRKKVLRIAKELDYKPYPAARILAGGANFKIGVCIPKEIHFFYDQMRSGIFDEARRVSGFGVEILYAPVQALGKGEGDVARSLLDRAISALVLTPGDPDSVTPLINEAEARDVRVICITTDAPQSHRSSAVCVDPELNGRLAAELLSKFVGPEAEVAIITGMLSTEEHRLKTEGFCAAFQEDRAGKVAAILEAHESEEESYHKTCELLSQHPKLTGIYVSTVNCLPVCRALQQAGGARQIQLITTDLFPEMVPHLREGTIRASIYQNPYLQGQIAVRLLVDNLLNGIAIPHASYLNPGIVLKTNLHLFREAQDGSAAQQLAGRRLISFGS